MTFDSGQRPRGVRTLRVGIVGEYVQIRGTSERASMRTFASNEMLQRSACRQLPPNKPSAFLDGHIEMPRTSPSAGKQERARAAGPRGGWWLRTRKGGCTAASGTSMDGRTWDYGKQLGSIVSVRI